MPDKNGPRNFELNAKNGRVHYCDGAQKCSFLQLRSCKNEHLLRSKCNKLHLLTQQYYPYP